MSAVGVDGWRGRWVAARADGPLIAWSTHDTFDDVLAAHSGAAVIAVDMPMGDFSKPRVADTLARRWLIDQGGSGSSIFPAPPQVLVESWSPGAEYLASMRSLGEAPKISKQAWNLIPSIRQVAAASVGQPRGRLIEAHPECTFACLARHLGRREDRQPVRHSKKTAVGMALRLSVLHEVFTLPDLQTAPRGVPVDDLLDATAIAWTAQRFAEDPSGCMTFPGDGSDSARIVVGPIPAGE